MKLYIFNKTCIISVVFLLTFIQKIQSSKRTVLTHLIYRHGERTPEDNFSWNENHDDEWNKYGGLGQLTREGKITEFNVGTKIKNRYIEENKLIEQKYNPNEVLIRSSEIYRCIMSAQIQAASTFSPIETDKFIDDLNWQPIPIITHPKDSDYLLRSYSANCPNLQKFYEQSKQDSNILSLSKKYENTLTYINEITNSTYYIHDLPAIYDVFKVERENNITSVFWISDQILLDLKQASKEYLQLTFLQDSHKYRRLFGGRLLNDIATRMEQYLDNQLYQNDNKKLIIYSGHFKSIWSITNALNLAINEIPAYGAIFAIDLIYDDKIGNYIVEIFMDNGKNFELINMYDCPYPCLLKTFLDAYEEFRMRNVIRECGIETVNPEVLNNKYKLALVIVTPILSIVSLTLILGVIIYFSIKQRRVFNYQFLPDQGIFRLMDY